LANRDWYNISSLAQLHCYWLFSHFQKEGKSVDFIERLFDVAPDGGDGTFEAAFCIVAFGTILVVIFRHRLLVLFRMRKPKVPLPSRVLR
jgi:hypothetical protein